MHIPEGYLSPQTCLVLGTACLPLWRRALARVQREARQMQLPLLALGAAFAFAIQMLNVPVPDGTTAHATGAALVAIVLGPWAALLALTVTLAIQALVFADGGILALGANVFNIGVLEVFTAYGLYRLLTRGPGGRRRRVWAAAAGAFAGINVAALAAGVELGLQPLLFHTPDGMPLYAPYPLSLAVPAMLYAHLLVAGPLEALITGLAVRYLLRTGHTFYGDREASGTGPAPATGAVPDAAAGAAAAAARTAPDAAAHAAAAVAGAAASAPVPAPGTAPSTPAPGAAVRRNRLPRWGWYGLAAAILAAPLGLLASGTAWGEWGPQELAAHLGYVPAGLARWAGRWAGLLPDYALPGVQGSRLALAIGYWLSAAVGTGLIALCIYLVGRAALRPSPGEAPGRSPCSRNG